MKLDELSDCWMKNRFDFIYKSKGRAHLKGCLDSRGLLRLVSLPDWSPYQIGLLTRLVSLPDWSPNQIGLQDQLEKVPTMTTKLVL